jgi:hypothetical protein
MRKAILLMAGAFLLSAAVTFVLINRSESGSSALSGPAAILKPVPQPEKTTTTTNPVAGYKPPEGRTPELQVFDKAVLFLGAQQEADGHWSVAKSGGAPGFANLNGDITLTAICTAAMLDACSFKQTNPEALGRARKGLDWLTQHVRENGAIGDEAGPGEPVAAQIFSALTFLQAGDLSSRASVRENAAKLCRYAITAMTAEPGGFGATKGAKATRADLTAWATVLFNQARSAYVPFYVAEAGKTENEIANLEADSNRKTERSIRAALKALQCEPKSSGAFARSSDKLEPDWDATVSGLLVDAAFVIQGNDVQSGLKYMLGTDYDPEKTRAFPGITQHATWGEKGNGYSALSLMTGSMMMYNVFGPQQAVWGVWSNTVIGMLSEHQLPDGSWDAAGPDASLGRFWRTALNARVLVLLAPPQMPPPPPPVPQPGEPTAPAPDK